MLLFTEAPHLETGPAEISEFFLLVNFLSKRQRARRAAVREAV